MLERLNLAIVDVETTGPTAAYDRIIEIGIKRVERGELVASYSTLLNPERLIPPFIQRMTGITDEQVADASPFSELAAHIRQLLEGCVFVAHNVRFDYGFLRHEFRRANHAFSSDCLCTVRLSRLLYPRWRKHSLSSLIQRFQFSCANRHRALDDADVVWQFMAHIERTVDQARLAKAMSRLLARPVLPPQLRAEAIDALPSGPGVYVFLDAHGTPLYVGKSMDIQERVLAHFSGDHESGKTTRIRRQAARIQAIPAYGELGALLLESQWIRRLSPLHNRPSHPARSRKNPGLVQGSRLEADRILDFRFSIFDSRNAKHVSQSQIQNLKSKISGPQTHSPEPPRPTELAGRGGRTSNEGVVRQPARDRRIRPWPYAGPVTIEEAAADRAQGHLFILDGWQVVRALAYSSDGAITCLWEPTPSFDVDQYRILRRYLSVHGQQARPLDEASAQRLLADGGAAEWEAGALDGYHSEAQDVERAD